MESIVELCERAAIEGKWTADWIEPNHYLSEFHPEKEQRIHALNRIAKIYEETKKFDEACTVSKRVLSLDPTNKIALNRLERIAILHYDLPKVDQDIKQHSNNRNFSEHIIQNKIQKQEENLALLTHKTCEHRELGETRKENHSSKDLDYKIGCSCLGGLLGFLLGGPVGGLVGAALGYTAFSNEKQKSDQVASQRPAEPEKGHHNGKNPIKFSFETRVAGVTFENRQEYVKKLCVGEQVFLRKEVNNPYDSSAIGVYNKNGKKLGYIPKDLAKIYAQYLVPGNAIVATVIGVRISVNVPEFRGEINHSDPIVSYPEESYLEDHSWDLERDKDYNWELDWDEDYNLELDWDVDTTSELEDVIDWESIDYE